MAKKKPDKLKIMVSSTVYHFQPELEQLCPTLTDYGYRAMYKVLKRKVRGLARELKSEYKLDDYRAIDLALKTEKNESFRELLSSPTPIVCRRRSKSSCTQLKINNGLGLMLDA